MGIGYQKIKVKPSYDFGRNIGVKVIMSYAAIHAAIAG